MAASFIEHQRVSKRRDLSHLHTKSAFSGAGFIHQFKQFRQKPQLKPRLKPQASPTGIPVGVPTGVSTDMLSGAQTEASGSGQINPRENADKKGFNNRRKKGFEIFRKSPMGKGFFSGLKNIPASVYQKALENLRKVGRISRFRFPVPSLMTMVVVAGTLFVSVVALNWRGLEFSVLDTGAIPPPPPRENTHLLTYANTGIVPFAAIPAEGQEYPAFFQGDGAGIYISESPLDLIPDFQWHTYRVQRGDSVSVIASRFGVSMDAVIASNGIENARRLREGQTLRIPNMDGIPHTVARGDTITRISIMHNVPKEIILDVNDIRSDVLTEGEILFIPGARMAPDALRLSLGEQFIFPVARNISSGFGWRPDPFTGRPSFHRGIDLRGSIGTPVRASKDGTVARLGNSRVYGQYIILTHAGGFQTLYAHLSAFSVRQGERVRQGAQIGAVGNTGMSTGPHLHFGIHRNGTWVNPLDFLN